MRTRVSYGVAVIALSFASFAALEMFDHWITLSNGNDTEYTLVLVCIVRGHGLRLGAMIVIFSPKLLISNCYVLACHPHGSLLFMIRPIALVPPQKSAP